MLEAPFPDLPPGSTFVTLQAGVFPHLWIACSDTVIRLRRESGVQESCVWIVSINTEPRFHDATCLIQPGEHRFVTKPAYVRYATCRPLWAGNWVELKRTGYGIRDPLDRPLLLRVLTGAVASSQISREAIADIEKLRVRLVTEA
jgi:hypothetical protein